MLTQRGYIRQKIVANEAMQIGAGVGCNSKFHAVTSREHNAFHNARMLQQFPCSLLQAPLWNREPFPYFDGSGFVVYAEELELHRDTNL